MSVNLESYFASVQKSCLPGVWSKGVAFQRDGAVSVDAFSPKEIICRIRVKDKPVSPKVTLWPEDEDQYCDCGDRVEPCPHIAAAVIACRAGARPGAGGGEAANEGASRPAQSTGPRLIYRLTRQNGALHFERKLAYSGKEAAIEDALVSWVGGVQSGRISLPMPTLTREDYGADGALGQRRKGVLDGATWKRLLPFLEGAADLELDGEKIRAVGKALGMRALVQDENGGFRIRRVQDAESSESFSNGVALIGGALRAIDEPALTAQEREWVSEKGFFFTARESARWVSEYLPELERKLPVDIRTTRLPRLVDERPRVVLKTDQLPGETLTAVATIVYGHPPIATLRENGSLELTQDRTVPRRDLAEERSLVRRLQAELHLTPGQLARYSGDEAVQFSRKLKGWDVQGGGVKNFAVDFSLVPRIEAGDEGFGISFDAVGPGVETGSARAASLGADPARVFQAWAQGSSFVPLLGGGFAPLPVDWLNRYGSRVLALLEAREHHSGPRKLDPQMYPAVIELIEETGQALPGALKRWKDAAEKFEGIPSATLPSDLKADLRHYQRQGVDWLSFLRDSGMGALLADDMGLGKTLQTLCAIRGKTLIVTPTSVLYGWASQIEKFRPGLRYSVYHGSGRKLDESADIVLTTYALMRLDQELLSAREWGSVVLDEAQTIKNPESQVAKAAHRLRGEFRVALSGTPVENRLDDLWSQMHFVNPGMLGSRADFQDEFAAPAMRGDRKTLERLRRRIKPLILRRLKREVAPELPPRTETVLHCELSDQERDLYGSILASSRKEVLEKLEAGSSVFAALELLLRLRQACCHPALVPGGADATGGRVSSKIDLLLETLEESIENGHRALVFSQWTGLLDLIEPRLRGAKISFSRIDGSTSNRQQVVEQFQSPDGPSVLLISLKAGGTGLTLTAADHVFILDPWWNPAVEDQAADRAHRIGQTNPVLIHRLVARDTVEDRILALQKKKQELAGAVLEDSGAAISITKNDLMEILS